MQGNGFSTTEPHLQDGDHLVSTYEVLSQLTLPNLKKIAKRLGIHVKQGLSGFIAGQAGLEIRRPYIQALATSNLVTLEEIDSALGTHYSRLRDEPGSQFAHRERAGPQDVPPPTPRERKSKGFLTSESIVQFALDRYLYKEDVQELCHELGLPGGGNKEELIFRVLGAPNFQPEMALAYVDKEGLKQLCDELGLRTQGTREDLVDRLLQAIHARRGARPSPPASYQPYPVAPPAATQSEPYMPLSYRESQPPHQAVQREPPSLQETARPVPLEFPETPSPTLLPEPVAPQIAQLQMVSEFLESYRPSQRFRNEQAYEIEVAQSMRHHFGNDNVKTQANIAGGRIDIEALGIGVEIKVPTSRGQLQTLLGQILVYRNYYGPNLVVLVFNDLAKYQDVNEFANILRGRGIQVFVK